VLIVGILVFSVNCFFIIASSYNIYSRADSRHPCLLGQLFLYHSSVSISSANFTFLLLLFGSYIYPLLAFYQLQCYWELTSSFLSLSYRMPSRGTQSLHIQFDCVNCIFVLEHALLQLHLVPIPLLNLIFSQICFCFIFKSFRSPMGTYWY